MSVKTLLKTAVVGSLISTGAIGTENECKQLSYTKGNETYVVDINKGKGQIGEFVIEIKGKVIKAYISDSDESVGFANLINDGSGDCLVGSNIVE